MRKYVIKIFVFQISISYDLKQIYIFLRLFCQSLLNNMQCNQSQTLRYNYTMYSIQGTVFT